MTGFELKKILLCCAVSLVSVFVLPISVLGFTGEGLGTEDYPYRITDCDELQEMNDDRTADYVLLNDIDCTDSAGWNEGDGYYPPQDFTGSLDGRNYTIDNLFSDTAGVDGGLFGVLNSGIVRNVHLTNADFTFTSNHSGGIAGQCADGCIISGSSFNGTLSGQSYTGGIAGSIEDSEVYECWSSGTIDGNSGYVGGFVGFASDAEIYDSYTIADVVNGSVSGGFASRLVTEGGVTTVDRVYAAGTIFADNYLAAFSGSFEQFGGGTITISNTLSATTFDTNRVYNYVTNSGGSYNEATFDNSFYDNTLSNGDAYANECTFYGVQVECSDVDSTTLYNTSSAAPFYDGAEIWDFTNIWQVETDGLPTLRESAIDDLNPLGPPEAPVLYTDEEDYEAVLLFWEEPLNGGDEITDYIINYREDGDEEWTEIDTESTDVTYYLEELTPDTDYEARVAAVNGNGAGDYSEAVSFSTLAIEWVEISSCQEFQDMTDYPYNGYFVLTQNIDCEDFDEDGVFDPLLWEEGGYFGGTLDGQGYTISNLLINDDSISADGIYAIFPIATTGTVIRNLGIENANISVSNALFAGILVGLGTETEIDEVSVTGVINAGVTGCDMLFCAFGGAIATTYGPWDPGDGSIVNNSYSRVDINLFDVGDTIGGGVGGFMGVGGLTLVTNSYAEGTIYIEDMDYEFLDWGGFIGASLGDYFVNSFSAVELTYEGESIPGDPGGFMGYNDGDEYFENVKWLYNNDDIFTCDQGGDNEGCSMIDSGIGYFKSVSNEPLASWDFDEVWNINSEINDGLPYLTWQSFEDEEEPEEDPEEEEPEEEVEMTHRSSTGSRINVADRYSVNETNLEFNPTSSGGDFSFTDTSNHWAEEFADKLKEKCDVFGYQNEVGEYLKTFGPDNAITRAELVRMLIACKHIENLSFEQHFPDVNQADWFSIYITYAFNEGWIQGYQDGEFKPNQPITRAEAIKIILLSHYSAEDIIGQDATFSDVDISAWYSEFVTFAEELGFVSGYTDENGEKTGEFKPENNITRGESAKIISLVLGL